MTARAERSGGDDAGYTYPFLVHAIRSIGLTYRDIARMTGVRERQVQNWAAGSSRPRDLSRDRLVDVHYLVEQLLDVYRPEGAEIWLHAKNRVLGGRRPIDMLADGDFAPVLDAVHSLQAGAM